MQRKAQTALEYMLMIGAVLAFVGVAIMMTRGNVFGTTETNIGETNKELGDILASIPAPSCKISNILPSTPILSRFLVSWNTDLAASSTLEFTDSNLKKYYASDPALIGDHSLFVDGVASGEGTYVISSCAKSDCCSTQGTFVV